MAAKGPTPPESGRGHHRPPDGLVAIATYRGTVVGPAIAQYLHTALRIHAKIGHARSMSGRRASTSAGQLGFPVIPAIGAEADHVRPVSRGGAGTGLASQATACVLCNTRKAERTLEELGWSCIPTGHATWDGCVSDLPRPLPARRANERAIPPGVVAGFRGTRPWTARVTLKPRAAPTVSNVSARTD